MRKHESVTCHHGTKTTCFAVVEAVSYHSNLTCLSLKGRSTGVPTIQEKLAANGSPRATFETTEDRLTFLIHIPVHAGCDSKPLSGTDEENSPVTTETTTERTTEKIIRLMRENPQITNKELAAACDITEDGVYWNTKKLRKNNVIHSHSRASNALYIRGLSPVTGPREGKIDKRCYVEDKS